ncbi:MAG: threonine/serine exporter family protein [Candidatus Marsarchaeota archaeon]|nr:threonine/serine exporter family protein [Candidatus Marsarchaeota archaeon]
MSLQFFSEIIFSVVIPLSTLIFYARAIGADLFIKDRKVRAPLFYLGIISFFIGYLFLRFSGAPFIVTALMLSYAINTVAALILNFTLNKVSVHAWGISGPAVAVLYQYGPVAFVITIIAALFVGFTRIKMEHHTINEVVLALFTSVAITMLVIYAFPIGLMR